MTLAPILRQGRNCWRSEHAQRLALIVDAQEYFCAVKWAILQAKHVVYLVGWDFDTRVEFEPGKKTLEGPNALGAFLRWIGRERPDLHVYILKWDLGVLFDLARGSTPFAMLGWLTSRRIHFKLDSAHPKGAAPHQKIVVIDDVLAFCGGIDITLDRWDTRAHQDNDERRRRSNGKKYDPWHDATTAIDGGAASALGDLARQRWKLAAGEHLASPPRVDPLWPPDLVPAFTDIQVAISRTVPEHLDVQPVREIEALYLDAIAGATRTIYCESQYFASDPIAQAMARKLREQDGPEIVVVNPKSADGYLEAAAMDSARARLLKLVGQSDRYDRFRIYTPVTEQHHPIYVHAKILIVDNRLLKVGSSNLNNRSLGFDVECDLAIEADEVTSGSERIEKRIEAVLWDLLAEHLGTEPHAVAAAYHAQSSLIAAIDSLRGEGRTLVPYIPKEPSEWEKDLDRSNLLDPEGPPAWKERVMSFLNRTPGGFR